MPAGGFPQMGARKEETSVACAAPFRRQGFGHVMSECPYELL